MSFSVRLQIAKFLVAAPQATQFTLKLIVSMGFLRDFHGRLMALTAKLTRSQVAGMSLSVNSFGNPV
jgi:hypothetical protein